MMILSKDKEIARLSLAIISSYSASLLEARKSKRMACYIISLVGASSCSPSPTPVCREVPSTFKIHQSGLFDFVSY